jgi:hypothetical protein
MILRAALAATPAYQGHLPDGSSIQKHSAGPMYPFMFRTHEVLDERGCGTGYADIIDSLGVEQFSFMWPIDPAHAFVTKQRRLEAYEKALDAGHRLADVRREAA